MARQKKPHISMNIKIEKNIAEKLNEIAETDHMTKTSIIERALLYYYERYDKTGSV